MNVSVRDTLRFAIEEKRRVSATNNGVRRILSPHALGEKDGRARALFLQSEPIGGTDSLEDQWRCMDIDKLLEVTIWDDAWVRVGTHSRRSTCMDYVDVEVNY